MSAGSLDVDGISYIPSTVLLTGIQKVALKDNNLFSLLDAKGECPRLYRPELGFYYRDTRYLSLWDLTINGQVPVHLAHDLRGQGKSCIFTMTNRDIPSLDGNGRIPRDSLMIRRVVTLHEETVFEHLELTNYGASAHLLELQQVAGSIFDDIFEVRGFKRERRGEVMKPRLLSGDRGAMLSYRGLDGVERQTYIECHSLLPEIALHDQAAVFTYRLRLEPKSMRDLKTVISFDRQSGGTIVGESFREMTISEHSHITDQFSQRSTLAEPRIESDNPIIDRCLKNARIDIEMLATFNPRLSVLYPFAGIPWFSAPFGRDGLLTAYQCLPWFPELASGVLTYAFEHIGNTDDDFTDQEPGKIFHELRVGEMAHLKEIPYIPYFGSVDSTPLTLILLGEYIAWTHDLDRLKTWWPSALRALSWLEKSRDLSPEGFLTYHSRSTRGLKNQGWKDSGDSIMHESGELAPLPISLCEAQAYAYRARLAMSDLALLLGETRLRERLVSDAERLRQSFEARYWNEQDHYIYLALDGKNQPCRVMSSNQGHCLWGGIASEAQGRAIAGHLLSARLFSGYGVRTLAADERSFNPLSYHNGSIWPHDNSLIAEGLRYYGQNAHLQTLADALYDVAALSNDFRLPELFCGFRRRGSDPPVPYEVACRPQAWAAGSMFLLLKALLGLSLAVHDNKLILQSPLLPSRISTLEIQGLRVRKSTIDLLVQRSHGICHVEVLRRTGPVQVLVAK